MSSISPFSSENYQGIEIKDDSIIIMNSKTKEQYRVRMLTGVVAMTQDCVDSASKAVDIAKEILKKGYKSAQINQEGKAFEVSIFPESSSESDSKYAAMGFVRKKGKVPPPPPLLQREAKESAADISVEKPKESVKPKVPKTDGLRSYEIEEMIMKNAEKLCPDSEKEKINKSISKLIDPEKTELFKKSMMLKVAILEAKGLIVLTPDRGQAQQPEKVQSALNLIAALNELQVREEQGNSVNLISGIIPNALGLIKDLEIEVNFARIVRNYKLYEDEI